MMWLLGFIEISVINKFFVYDGFVFLIIFVTFIIYACVCLEGKFPAFVFVNLFAADIVYTLGSLAIFVMSYLSGLYAQNMISDFTVWRVLGVCFCRLFEFLIYKLIIRFNGKYAMSKFEWALFISLPILTWMVVTIVTSSALEAVAVSKNMFLRIMMYWMH